jgi:hypothetical protein
MNIKQLAERIGVAVKDIDFEIGQDCKNCVKVGGSETPCEDVCNITVLLQVKT